jgi:hypothetical protein
MRLRLLLVKARAEPSCLVPMKMRSAPWAGTAGRTRNLSRPRPLCKQREAVLDHALDYAQLEQGARYLASLSRDDAERREHLGWANRYSRLRMDASESSSMAHATR